MTSRNAQDTDSITRCSDPPFWTECIKQWYPELHKKTYFLPPLYFNRVPYSLEETEFDQIRNAKPTKSGNDCHIREDRAQELLLHRLRAMVDKNVTEAAMLVISQLQFGKYLNKPCYTATAASFPGIKDLPGDFHQGDCDILLVHSQYGLLVGEVKSVGENFGQLKCTKKRDTILIERVKKAVKQMNKAEIVLKHLVFDLKEVNVTSFLILPYVESSLLMSAMIGEKSQNWNKSEGTDEFKQVIAAVETCLCADQLLPSIEPWEVTSDMISKLSAWWRHLVSSTVTKKPLQSATYERLVARFCGPATTVEIHCMTKPRLELRLEDECVSEAGERIVQFVLYPEQVKILNTSLSGVFLVGPPGTGKTVVLVVHGLNRLQQGHDVYVVSTSTKSRAAAIVIEYQMKKTTTPSKILQIHRLDYDFIADDEAVPKAVQELASAGTGQQVCIILDEAGPDYESRPFHEFCRLVMQALPNVCLWAASVYRAIKPEALREFRMETPFRSPPVVVREVAKSPEIRTLNDIYSYCPTIAHTDGPPVQIITHRMGESSHVGYRPDECEQCGIEVATILTNLRVGRTHSRLERNPPTLQYRDVLVLCDNLHDDQVDSSGKVTQTAIGIVRGLRARGLPVRVVRNGADHDSIADIALSRSDVVTVTHMDNVRGLERKIIVTGTGLSSQASLHCVSRCSAQLVLIK